MEPKKSTLEILGRIYVISGKPCEGAVDVGRVTLNGIKVKGWALNSSGTAPAGKIALLMGGRLHFIVETSFPRPDISRTRGELVLHCGFSCDIPIDSIPGRFKPDVCAYALDDNGTATPVPIYRPGYFLNIHIDSWRDFSDQIQVPSTRISDPETAAMVAYHCYHRFESDYVVKSGALCVIGYRLLCSPTPAILVLRPFFAKAIKELAEEVPSTSPGVYLRWHTSLRLLQGYWNLQQQDLQAAMESFAEVKNHWHSLDFWPSAISNLLIAALLAGLIYQTKGNFAAALHQWSGSDELLKSGIKNAKFENTYAFDELINAVTIARECKVGILASPNMEINDGSIAPPGRRVNIFNIGNIASLPHNIFEKIQPSPIPHQ